MDSTEFLIVQASKTTGVMTQKGLLLLRPHYALFAPTETAINALGAVVGGLAGAAAGFVVRTVPGKFPNVQSYLEALTAEPAADFDAQVHAIAPKLGWWLGAPADTTIELKKLTVMLGRYRLVLRRGKEVVAPTFGLAKKTGLRAEPLASRWSSPA